MEAGKRKSVRQRAREDIASRPNKKATTSEPSLIESNEKEIKKLVSKLNLISDFNRVFSTEEGQRVLKWLLNLGSPMNDVFTGNSETYYSLGQQKVIRQIIQMSIKAECELNISDYEQNIDKDTLTSINSKIDILQIEINKEKTGGSK